MKTPTTIPDCGGSVEFSDFGFPLLGNSFCISKLPGFDPAKHLLLTAPCTTSNLILCRASSD